MSLLKPHSIFTVLFLILSYFVINKSAEYNWDIIPYMAIVKYYDNNEINEVSDYIYGEIKKNVDDKKFKDLTLGSDYRKKVFENSKILKEQLSFYESKIGYNILVYLSYKSGFDIVSATYRINIIFYLLIGFLLFYFIAISINNWFAIVATLLIMASEQVVKLALYSTPDAMSTFVILLVFLMIYKRKDSLTIILLTCVAILIRPDNILFGGVFLFYLYYTKDKKAIIFFVYVPLLLLVYLLNTILTGHPGWSTLFYHAFEQRVLFPITNSPSISIDLYISAIKEVELGMYSYMIAIVALLFQMVKHICLDKFEKEESITYLLIVLVIVKTLIFPINEERFFIAIDIVLLIYFTRTILGLYKTKKNKNKASIKS